ncbi:hypothetical protein CR513_25758, partial [Mucuna pruriens]
MQGLQESIWIYIRKVYNQSYLSSTEVEGKVLKQRKKTYKIFINLGKNMIVAIQDLYDKVTTSVRTSRHKTEDFPIMIGLHQGSTLSPCLFNLMLDEFAGDT